MYNQRRKRKIDKRTPKISVSELNSSNRLAQRNTVTQNSLLGVLGHLSRRTLVAPTGQTRFGQVIENPAAKDNIKVSLYTGGVLATSGDEFEIDCYALICNGTRLDMAEPRLSNGQDVIVTQNNVGDGLRWYFNFNFNGTEDYTV